MQILSCILSFLKDGFAAIALFRFYQKGGSLNIMNGNIDFLTIRYVNVKKKRTPFNEFLISF
ncbi:MAG TPA: hypothetical protein VK645_19810 [Chitinophagaceae bacterium]|nr:hypothetical protein [Chitinophagaceae bacterium]